MTKLNSNINNQQIKKLELDFYMSQFWCITLLTLLCN
jgi:hypothetical protein